MKAVNIELERLEDKNARLPNGEMMDLWSLREQVVVYCTSLEGDEYINGPAFLSAADALLYSLNPMFRNDTIGLVSAEFPANSKVSNKFRFNSMLRLREYVLDARTFYYDARAKIRPACIDVGVTNFKMTYDMRLPHGNNFGNAGQSNFNQSDSSAKAKGLTVDQILFNIISDQSEIQVIRIEAFYFCEPGKTMRIERSYRIDMGTLYGYFCRKLGEGFDPNRMRNEIFLGPNAGNAIVSFLQDRQIPSTIGDIPEKLVKSISQGDSLEMLLAQCAVTTLGQKTCISGQFFEKLWQRDVKSVFDYYEIKAFEPADKLFLYANIQLKLRNPYVVSWMFKEDYRPEMGRDVVAYNWNYNRFLDVNTTIFWLLVSMQMTFDLTVKQLGGISTIKTGPFLVDTKSYQAVKHQNLIYHRFSLVDVSKFKTIRIYDTCGDNRVEITFTGNRVSQNPDIDARSQALTLQGQPLTNLAIVINTASISGSARSLQVRAKVQSFLDLLISKTKGLLSLSKGLGEETQIINFAPANQTINDIPVNYFILEIVASFLRGLIRVQEFAFFSYQ